MCERCGKFEKHIEDLRNKCGRIYAYYQIKKMMETDSDLDLTELEKRAEQGFMDSTENFVELLKKEI